MAERSTRRKRFINYQQLNSVGWTVSDEPEKEMSAGVQDSPSVSPKKQTVDERPDDIDCNMVDKGEAASLKRYLQELEEREARLEEERELEVLRQKVQEKERKLKGMERSIVNLRKESVESKKKVKVDDTARKESLDRGMLNIDSLRKLPGLKKQAKEHLFKLGLIDDSDTDSDTSCSSSDTEESESESSDSSMERTKSRKVGGGVNKSSKQRIIKSKKAKKSKKKSGIEAKISDEVVNKQRFPQAHLRFDFASQGLSFNQLSLNLLVAGELEIISVCTDKKEKKGRIELLKNLMYLASSHEFSIVRALYAAVLREIEMGLKNWGDDFLYVENAVLNGSKSKGKSYSSTSADDRKKANQTLSENSNEVIWFCSKFQRNKCPHKTSHTLVVKGKMRYAKHICASCWQKDRKQLEHPECSSACPHTSE